MSTKKRKKLWSVTRIQDPRYCCPETGRRLTVRVTELEPGGTLYVTRRVEGRDRWASLGVTRLDLGSARDQEEEARAKGLHVLEHLALGRSLKTAAGGEEMPAPTDLGGKSLTLQVLTDEYGRHGLVGRSIDYQRDQPRKLQRISDFLGGDREVRSLSRSDVQRFEVARRAEGVRDGTIHADLLALKVALRCDLPP